jgi:tetratricopeptide (TPR) repeat protein
MQNREAAINMAEKAVAVNIDNVEGHIRLGRLYYLKGNLKRAEMVLNSAANLCKDDPRPHFYLGLIAEQRSEIKVKQSYFNLAKQRHKKVSEKVGWRVDYESYSGYFLHPGCLELIEQGYRYKLRFANQLDKEEQIDLKNNFAYFLARQKKHLEYALQLTDECIKSKPDNATILDTKSVILYQLGEIERAHGTVREFEDRIQLFELRGDPTFAYYLGKIKWAVGDRDKAKYYFDFILNTAHPDILSKIYKEEIESLLVTGS